MLDTNKLKVGSMVKLTGKIVQENPYTFVVAFKADECEDSCNLVKDVFLNAELISTPVTFTDEQIEAIKEASVNAFKPGKTFIAIDESWLEGHREKK